ncbi:GMC oxidoreductase [Spirosoma utsteinense]|uniref:Choline dehydrogenase-like flavoprotein n=1 Tax=Spirosoma utsteinense TaxID=2585773 RepID=A0ABR6WAA6_9BACT|nr:GMC family oxidoreductase [Spirosoma utsteinense]MBC3784021.1 choline dehydrogenase-like flavoprotein [Spirosoma utsteinense]MBC3793490.1 choline dehydrogenase-like flavoprotein [Spirosoma utsteinense]
MHINGDARKQNTYDAIVIGSGISGGWAAKDLCEKGLKTLVLERGRDVKHIVDYPTATLNPWEFPHRNRMPEDFDKANPIATKCYALDEATEQFFVKDAEHPYVQEKPFDWIKGYQVGGKSLIWARQTQRWSKFDFEANARDGAAVDWPIRYEDVAPWYSHVEKFVGISGNKDGLETLPDGEFLKPWELNCVEKHIQKRVADSYKDRHVIIGRCAHLTDPQQIHYDQGRAQCQARHLCYRGCLYGAYFSSNSSTLPWAAKTGNLTLRPDSIVHSIIYDEASAGTLGKGGRATGVRVIDTHTRQLTEYYARIIFVNAACLNTNLLLLHSTSRRFPNGLGNDSGTLGRYVAFHNYRGNITADYEGFEDGYYYGRRPTTAFMPNFRNVDKQEVNFQRGYMVAFSAARSGWQRGNAEDGFGADFKNKVTDPGAWHVFMMMQGETVPRYENHVRLSADQKDPWGIPQLITSIGYTKNDLDMMKDFLEQGADMLDKAGCTNINPYDDHRNPGLDIHEMGGVRMGRDPKTSMLNAYNQMHSVKNVFVTDGAAMTSTGTQNPSITFMALTARAVNYAVAEMKKKNL